MNLKLICILYLSFLFKIQALEQTFDVKIEDLDVDLFYYIGGIIKCRISAFGETWNLKLKFPDVPVFSSEFNFTLKDGQISQIPNLEEVDWNQLWEMKHMIMVDEDAQAVVKISRISRDNILLKGIIGDKLIEYDDNAGKLKMTQLEDFNGFRGPLEDEELVEDLESSSRTRRDIESDISIKPELLVVIDRSTYIQDFGEDWEALLEYIAMYVIVINNRYATIPSMQIKFQVVGIYVLKDFEEAFLFESTTHFIGGINIANPSPLLRRYARWLYTKEDLHPFDMALWLTRAIIKGDGGRAFNSGACQINYERQAFIGTSLVHDKGAQWIGSFWSAHELAHNLGTTHDGNGTSYFCSPYDGYVMSSSTLSSRNKFRFSNCSIDNMRRYIESPQAQCLKTASNEQVITFPVPRPINFDNRVCELADLNLDGSGARLVTSPEDGSISRDSFCTDIHCIKPDGEVVLITSPPPPDNITCGNHGEECYFGECVLSKEELSSGLKKIGEYEGKEFYLYRNQPMDWQEATHYCENRGLKLAQIASHDEQIYLHIALMPNDDAVWLGARQFDAHSTDFTWISDGSKMKYANWGYVPSKNTCGLMGKNGWWIAYPCDAKQTPSSQYHWMAYRGDRPFGALCERQYKFKPPQIHSQPCANGNIGELKCIGNVDEKTFYFYRGSPMNWNQAVNFCREHNLEIAKITSPDEQNLIYWNVVKNRDDAVWLGASQKAIGVWDFSWSDGSNIIYTHWGWPLGVNQDLNCVLMMAGGWWLVHPCHINQTPAMSYQWYSYAGNKPYGVICEI